MLKAEIKKQVIPFLLSLTNTHLQINASKKEQRYQYQLSPQKLDNFSGWLKGRVRNNMLGVTPDQKEQVFQGKWWSGRFIQSSYKKGMTRAITELKKAGHPGYKAVMGGVNDSLVLPGTQFEARQDGMTASVEGAFNRPVNAERVAMLYARTFEAMEGISDAMGTSLSGILAQGMVDGESPYSLADKIAKTIDIGEARATTIARTETIRAHHQGSIATYAEAGVYGVEVMAETMTVAGDAENFEEMHVCPKCVALQERTRAEPITLEEALPLIPVHPNCRCVVIPKVTNAEEPLEGTGEGEDEEV
jgi:hypothetical protein